MNTIYATVRTNSGRHIECFPVSKGNVLHYGYVNYYGDKLSNPQVDRYNDIDNRIKQRAASGLIVDEADLNLRFEALIMPTLIKNGDKVAEAN